MIRKGRLTDIDELKNRFIYAKGININSFRSKYMYVVEKERGNNSNITLINQDTKASVIIGKMTMEILDILEEEGYKLPKIIFVS